MPPKITSPESICTPHVVSGHRGAGSRCWWVLLVGGGAALRCRLPLGGLEQGGDTEAHGYPRGRGAVVGVTGHPRAAPPPAQRDLKASWLVSPQEPSEECARKSTTSPRTRITSRTRPSISSVSPPLCAAPEPRPQQPPAGSRPRGGSGSTHPSTHTKGRGQCPACWQTRWQAEGSAWQKGAFNTYAAK